MWSKKGLCCSNGWSCLLGWLQTRPTHVARKISGLCERQVTGLRIVSLELRSEEVCEGQRLGVRDADVCNMP